MAITAPYNFVPLSDLVYQPDWYNEVTHDIPFEDGLCGTLDIKVTAYTALLVAKGTIDSSAEPYRLPNDEYAIPGSSLRGMIRNVLEIASFGKMKNVDDKRYGVRDLYSPFYQEKLSRELGNNEYESQTKSGFLQFSEGKWSITPCEYARVEHCLLETRLNHIQLKAKDVNEKYTHWLDKNLTLTTGFTHSGNIPYNHDKVMRNGKKRELTLHYKKVTKLTGDNGQLVFTGKMQNKHMEFVFFNPLSSAVEIKRSVMQGFLHIYNDSIHWKTLVDLEKKGKLPTGIPVFYLPNENNEIASIGLSQMYKLAYENSISDMISYSTPKHLENNLFDLAELIFGTLDDDDGKKSLKGRVSFSVAKCEKSKNEVNTFSQKTILNSPKPTFYPNYLKQNIKAGSLVGKAYQTYMDDTQLRGWKRYPVRIKEEIPILTPEQEKKPDVQIRLNPISASQESPISFYSKVRFHNLKREELGALIWAITWGGDTELYHSLGMGKSFGLGRVQLNVESTHIISNNNAASPSSLDCSNAFISMMNTVYKHCFPKHQFGWELSTCMLILKAMADPRKASFKQLKHMELPSFAFARHRDQRWFLDDYINVDRERKDVEVELRSKLKEEKDAALKVEDERKAQAQQKSKEAERGIYLSKFEVQEYGIYLYELMEDIKCYETTGLINKSPIQQRITPKVKNLLKDCSSWPKGDKGEAIITLEKVVEVTGLYNAKKRKALKAKVHSL